MKNEEKNEEEIGEKNEEKNEDWKEKKKEMEKGKDQKGDKKNESLKRIEGEWFLKWNGKGANSWRWLSVRYELDVMYIEGRPAAHKKTAM